MLCPQRNSFKNLVGLTLESSSQSRFHQILPRTIVFAKGNLHTRTKTTGYLCHHDFIELVSDDFMVFSEITDGKST